MPASKRQKESSLIDSIERMPFSGFVHLELDSLRWCEYYIVLALHNVVIIISGAAIVLDLRARGARDSGQCGRSALPHPVVRGRHCPRRPLARRRPPSGALIEQ